MRGRKRLVTGRILAVTENTVRTVGMGLGVLFKFEGGFSFLFKNTIS